MKNTLLKLAAVLFFFMLSFSSKAQWTGGGEQQRISSKATPNLLTKKDFFKIGFAMPSGDFGSQTSINSDGANTGFALQFGGIRYFDFDVNTNQFAIGYCYPFSFSFNNWESSDLSTMYNDITYRPYFFMGFGLGPLVSFTPGDQLIIDAFFNVKPTVSVAAGYKVDTTTADIQSYSNPAFMVGTNFGANLRYGSFIIGLDFMPAEFNYTMTTEHTDGSESEADVKIKTSVVNLTLGILL